MIPLVILALFLSSLTWIYLLDLDIQARLAQGWFLPPVEFYSSPIQFKRGDHIENSKLRELLHQSGLSEREAGLALRKGDWQWLNRDLCGPQLPGVPWPTETSACVGIWRQEWEDPEWLALNQNQILAVMVRDGEKDSALELPPQLFAQYYQGQPILRTVVDLGQVPLACSQAVTAIEDSDFLSHRGISPTGILRALARNLSKARFAEGASTITQQLVKNYFLTPEKTLRRKLKEQIMSLLLELRVDKDEILANYLNVIYMGQRGVFQVRGFAAAADHYFSKSLNDLSLSDCALLAAIINNPGRFHPSKHPDRALARRNLVLARMLELNMITAEEKSGAEAASIEAHDLNILSEPAPYFVSAAFDEIKRLNLNDEEGLKIFTALNPRLQEVAQVKAGEHVTKLEAQMALKRKLTSPLQVALISVDVASGGIEALVGGRSFKLNQFNRVATSRRQPGSLFKPFVYLAALESGDYHADSQIEDAPWSYNYEGQKWSPQNYDHQFRGPVTLQTALSQSLNVPTAKLATQVGLNSIAELAHRLGIESELPVVPALSLGAGEVKPIELAQAYLTLARLGSRVPIHLFDRVLTGQNEVLFAAEKPKTEVVRADYIRELISMMQETFASGSAKAALGWGITEKMQAWQSRHSNRSEPFDNAEDNPFFLRPLPAGKTGTTSDTKDTWFVGFTSDRLTLVWVGFDDNSPTGMAGASAALPLWYNVQFE